jgi:hypothetical protein
MIFVTFIRNGIILGIRHFEPDKVRKYWELHIYVLLFQINIIISE